MNVVADLFALLAKDAVGFAVYRTFHQVGQETVQFRSGMSGTCQAAAAETNGFHTKVLTVLLDEDICGDFAGAEQGMLALIDRQCFIDA